MVWADRQGNIGYQAVGIAPLRPNWSGLIPVPGDGRYEWNGYLPIKALPHIFNPAKGFIATANNYLFPPDYAYPDALHFTWADPFRASRITELLGSGRLESVPDMIRIQNDVTSIPARELTPLLRDLLDPRRDGRQGARPARQLERPARSRLGAGRHLRDVAAASADQHARPARAGGGAAVHRQPEPEEDDRRG